MAQKSLKTLAARNTSTLNRTHTITALLHTLFLTLRFLLLSRSLKPYILLTLSSLAIEIWFERIARPTYHPNSSEIKRAGEDLEAKGLTEWMWDVVYWTWGCIVLVLVFGDRAWWAYVVVPAYSVWLAFATFMGVKRGMGGMMGGGGGEGEGGAGQSKRQAKIEKRGQKMVYR